MYVEFRAEGTVAIMLIAPTPSENLLLENTPLGAIGHRILSCFQEDAFFVADLGEVRALMRQWQRHLLSVKPYYAVKCNPDEGVMRTLAAAGAGFDCASKGEMSQVLGLGIDPAKVVFAHPCKPDSHLRFAREHGIRRMTFDSPEELYKIKDIFPEAELILRIVTDDEKSAFKFSVKFGADLDQVDELLKVLRQLDLRLIGVAFHVGSGCGDPLAYQTAIRDAAYVFKKARELGFHPNLLDLGGGFHGRNSLSGPTLEEISSVVNTAIQNHFPDEPLEIVAEPGRYFVTSVFTLATRVCSKRNSNMYYINDGAYGSFSDLVYSEMNLTYKFLHIKNSNLMELTALNDTPATVWGPTGDSLDIVLNKVSLPQLIVGDWIVFENMGAYTLAISSSFNGFPIPKTYYIN